MLKDFFLLLSSINDLYINKALIKKFYNSFDNFDRILTDKSISIFEKEELMKIQEATKELNLDNIKNMLEKKEIKFISYCDKEYPEKLKFIDDPPFGLFYKGNLDLLNKKSVAIVGTRQATNYGLSNAKKIASMLTKQNIVVVSGFASGIDTASHKGAIENGKTIAVFGTGVDIVFPVSNRSFYNELLEKNNLIVSEY